MSFVRLTFLLGIGFLAVLPAEEKSKDTSTSKKDDQWLQKNIEQQQQFQENRREDADSKTNPFKAIAKPTEEKPKAPEPFSLISSKEKSPTPSSTKFENPKSPSSTTSSMSYKPAIPGMVSDSVSFQKRESESRSIVEQMESKNKEEDADSQRTDDILEKMKKDRLKQDLKNKSNDNLFGQEFNMPGYLNHQNLEGDRKNPYLIQNQRNQNPADRDQEKSNQDSFTHIPSIQMIKPIEMPILIENPNQPRSPFQNSSPTRPNQGTVYDQMMINPSTGKSRVQDPNDFLKR